MIGSKACYDRGFARRFYGGGIGVESSGWMSGEARFWVEEGKQQMGTTGRQAVMKKGIAFFLSVVVMALFCSCAVANPKYGEQVTIGGQTYDEIAVVRAKGSSSYRYRSQEHNRSQLESTTQDLFYVQLAKAATQISGTADKNGKYPLAPVTISGEKMPEEEILMVVNAFQRDNPQVFWIAGTFAFYYRGEDTVVELCSELSPEECGRAIWSLNSKVNEVLAGIPSDASEFDRELFLYDRLLQACVYDTVENKVHKGWKSYTAYGALVDGLAVCEGYSRAMQLLLSYVDMECALLTGVAEDSPHMWNVVSVEGDWYHLDPTWDDTEGSLRHTYFNLNDKTIARNHKTNPLYSQMTPEQLNGSEGQGGQLYNMYIPSCNEMEQNYLKQKAISVSTPISSLGEADRQSLIAELEKASSKETTELALRFPQKISSLGDVGIAVLNDCLNQANRGRASEEKLRMTAYSVDPLQEDVLVIFVQPKTSKP